MRDLRATYNARDGITNMDIRAIISVLSSVIAALLGRELIVAVRASINQKATGFGVVVGGLAEALASPRFWFLTLALVAVFFAASRIGNKALRILLFWTPAMFLIAVAFCFCFLLLYVRMHTPPS